MKLKPINLNGIELKNNVFIAPLAGFSDFAFRYLCLSGGASLAFTEMVSAKGLYYNSQASKELLQVKGGGENAVQLFGNDAFFIRSAVESEYLAPFRIVDINMGCPVPKIYNNGEGSFLMTDFKRAEEVISAVVKGGKIATAKMRLGVKKGEFLAEELAKRLEGAGASLITVHGRYKEDYYSGEIDYKLIEKVKKAVKIPVIVNGGIFTSSDAETAMERTGADGVMIARGAFYNPLLISELTENEPKYTLKEFIFSHIDLLKESFSDGHVAVIFRKMMPLYLKNVKCDKKIKAEFTRMSETEKIKNLLSEILN